MSVPVAPEACKGQVTKRPMKGSGEEGGSPGRDHRVPQGITGVATAPTQLRGGMEAMGGGAGHTHRTVGISAWSSHWTRAAGQRTRQAGRVKRGLSGVCRDSLGLYSWTKGICWELSHRGLWGQIDALERDMMGLRAGRAVPIKVLH